MLEFGVEYEAERQGLALTADGKRRAAAICANSTKVEAAVDGTREGVRGSAHRSFGRRGDPPRSTANEHVDTRAAPQAAVAALERTWLRVLRELEPEWAWSYPERASTPRDKATEPKAAS
jgi:hypothetical protein